VTLARPAVDHRDGRLSYQVLHEYYTTVTPELRPGMSRETAQADSRDLCAWQPVVLDRIVLEDAWLLETRFQSSLWDALIVASARATGCSHLLTEDLQHDQDLDGLRVVDPFRVAPGRLG
jgi:predicted nucleic acid-binding protein